MEISSSYWGTSRWLKSDIGWETYIRTKGAGTFWLWTTGVSYWILGLAQLVEGNGFRMSSPSQTPYEWDFQFILYVIELGDWNRWMLNLLILHSCIRMSVIWTAEERRDYLRSYDWASYDKGMRTKSMTMWIRMITWNSLMKTRLETTLVTGGIPFKFF